MEAELERFHKNNTQLELNINEIKQKWKATEKELQKERQAVRIYLFIWQQSIRILFVGWCKQRVIARVQVHDVEALVRRFKTDLHNCVGYIQDPKLLKEGIRALYKKHVQEDIVSSLLLLMLCFCTISYILCIEHYGYLVFYYLKQIRRRNVCAYF